MPRFDGTLVGQAQQALGVVRAGEFVRATGNSQIRRQMTLARLEALYELAYLRVFAAWEQCLECVFYRSLCGYASSAGQETLKSGKYYRSLLDAEAAVLGGGQFLLWHSPSKVIARCQKFFTSGQPGLQESVIASNTARLEHLAAIRHRIVHDQSDAKAKFDSATLTLAGRIYLASRPGRFLRDWDASATPRRRWIDVAISDLTGLASQIV